jgi:hypothetical protein
MPRRAKGVRSSNRTARKASYATGWDGDLVFEAGADGVFRQARAVGLSRTDPPHPALAQLTARGRWRVTGLVSHVRDVKTSATFRVRHSYRSRYLTV